MPRALTREELAQWNAHDGGDHTVPPPMIFLPEGRTDTANARRYTLRYANRVRWCDQWQKWLVWDGQRWAPDVTRAAVAHAKTIYTGILAEIGVPTDE